MTLSHTFKTQTQQYSFHVRRKSPNLCLVAWLVRYSTRPVPGACLLCNQLSPTDLFWRRPYCRLPQPFVWCEQLQQIMVCMWATWNYIYKTKKC